MGAPKPDLLDVFMAAFRARIAGPAVEQELLQALERDCALEGRRSGGVRAKGSDMVDQLAADVLRRALAGLGHATDVRQRQLVVEAVDFAERVVRLLYGGTRATIRKGMLPSEKASAIARGLQAGLPIKEVFSRAGVSRSTGFRILRSKSGRD